MSDFREFQDGELVPGTPYRVTRLIGAGGMGSVYEVEHLELGKLFVLKALLRDLSHRKDLVARLRNEWRALARLEHRNIVNVTDAGTSATGVPFYVMERLEGETLSALLYRARRLLPQQALSIAASILDGLHAAHQIGVVHRDVKPPNVFLTASGAVKVLDFGIAKIKDAQGVVTARGTAVGTPRYMSPEQAQGTAVDARSDIYAVGLMLFEMLSGVGPFDDAKDQNELLVARLRRPSPPLSSACAVLPEVDYVVGSLLAKDPRERPSNAQQVAETLRALSWTSAQVTAPAQVVHPSPSLAATKPEAPVAFARSPEIDQTTEQPALEIATTAMDWLPAAGLGFTERLAPPQPLTAPTFGSETRRDPPTQSPTIVPGGDLRTEPLLVAPPVPRAVPILDVGPTRTAVPLPTAEAPISTPAPIVPRRSLLLGMRSATLLATFAAVAVLAGSATAILRSRGAPARSTALSAGPGVSPNATAPAPAVPPQPAAPAPVEAVQREATALPASKPINVKKTPIATSKPAATAAENAVSPTVQTGSPPAPTPTIEMGARF